MKLFKLIKLLIVIIVVGGLFLLLINKTFVYDTYKSDVVKEGIPISRFMYVRENNLDVTFYTFVSVEKLESVKDEYLKTLDECYGKYYYDKDNDITITNYEIKSNKYYKEVNISYVKDNYCSSEYKLSDMWVYEYNSLSAYLDGDISEKAMSSLIDKVYNSKRVEPVVSDYKNEYSFKVNCDKNKEPYTLVFEDFGDNQLIVKKEVDGKLIFAVYEINNVRSYLGGLSEIK